MGSLLNSALLGVLPAVRGQYHSVVSSQSLLSSNSKLLVLCRLASALSQLLLAVNRSVNSDGIILKTYVRGVLPAVRGQYHSVVSSLSS